MKTGEMPQQCAACYICAAHQSLFHGDSLATQACIQLQHALVMLNCYKYMEGSMTPMKTMDEPHGTRLFEELRLLLQNNTLYATHDYVRDWSSKEGLTSMWRGDYGYAKFDVIKNKPHTSDKRPRGELPSCRGKRECDEAENPTCQCLTTKTMWTQVNCPVEQQCK